MTTIESARAEWTRMTEDAFPQQRLFDAHPLHLYFGTTANSAPLLLLVTDSAPNFPELSGMIETVRAIRADGKHATSVRLGDLRYSRAFIDICLELARVTQKANGETAALDVLVRTLDHWKKLFADRGERKLSNAEIRGLIAEIYFAVTYLTPLCGIHQTVEAWVGPLGAPQDFRCGGRLIEVKSLRPGTSKVWVSSVEQLDVDAPDGLVLATVEIDDDNFGSPISARSLQDWIAAIQDLAAGDPALSEVLESRWAALSFDPDDDYYGSHRFSIGEVRLYAVQDGFPVVRASSIPREVEEVKYRLRLGELQGFRVDSPFQTLKGQSLGL